MSYEEREYGSYDWPGNLNAILSLYQCSPLPVRVVSEFLEACGIPSMGKDMLGNSVSFGIRTTIEFVHNFETIFKDLRKYTNNWSYKKACEALTSTILPALKEETVVPGYTDYFIYAICDRWDIDSTDWLKTDGSTVEMVVPFNLVAKYYDRPEQITPGRYSEKTLSAITTVIQLHIDDMKHQINTKPVANLDVDRHCVQPLVRLKQHINDLLS